MMQIKPASAHANYEDIKALYEFLLVQTLPFPPKMYLQKDKNGKPCYYKNGDRKSDTIDVTAANDNRPYNNRPTLHEILYTFCQTYGKDLLSDDNTTDGEKAVPWIYERVCQTLYATSPGSSDSVLRHLLYAIPREKDVQNITEKLEAFLPQKDSIRKAFREILHTKVFDYAAFSRKKLFPKLIQMLNVNVCPYCNRSFTTTAEIVSGIYHRQNQVDHYVPKSRYPWFALSLNNLIPVCANCNQKKSDSEGFVLYPYEEGFGDAYRFQAVPVKGIHYLCGQPGSEEDFEIHIERNPCVAMAPEYEERVKNSIQKFGLDVLYQHSHNAYVTTIYRQRHIFSDAYIDSLIAGFPMYFQTRNDVRQMLYMKDIHANTEPLSKLTHDIDEAITRYGK